MGIGITLITRTTVVGFFIKVFSKNTGKKSRQIALGGSGYPIPSSYSAVGAGGLGGHCVLKWVLRGHFLGIKMPK